jgi:DNA-binding MarR family transcriptional regulator
MSSETSVDGGPLVGAMMRHVWQQVWKQIFSGVVAAGYHDVNPAHVGLFRYPGLDGQRPSELAEQIQITKQSVNDLLGHLEAHGYLTREPDPNDGRARVVRLTTKGRQLQKNIHGQARAAEQRIADALGARRYTQLRHALGDLTEREH